MNNLTEVFRKKLKFIVMERVNMKNRTEASMKILRNKITLKHKVFMNSLIEAFIKKNRLKIKMT
jgi:hypothetical protein